MAATFLDADVVIVGYGPSGVSAANFLGALGVQAIAFERAKEIYPRARAVTVDDWTMRCYQSVGLDEKLKAVMDETVALRWLTYDGREIRRVKFPPGEMGHARSYAIYQPAMEDVLRDGAGRYADHIEVRFGADVVDIHQDAEAATVTVEDAATGERSQVRARYVLACDGGSSGVRDKLGIKLLGDTVDTRWVVIDAKVKRWWPDRQLLTFWSDSERPVVDIALAMGNHRWELPLKPDESEADFETHEQLWALLATMGVSRDSVEIHQHAFYKHHVRRAERWREGRVFLVGDAAHLMPPWAGQGMQSGVRDAHMLSWKLAEVLAGRLPEAVLETYQAERAPDVERCTQLAIGLGHIIRQGAAAPPAETSATAASPPPASPRLQAGWITGAPRAANGLGRMLPQPRMSTPTGLFRRLDDLIGGGFVLLGDGVAPDTLLTSAQRAEWDAVGARRITVRGVQDRAEGPDEIVDLDGDLAAWMRTHKARVMAVRPDRFVAAVDSISLERPDVAAAASLRDAAA